MLPYQELHIFTFTVSFLGRWPIPLKNRTKHIRKMYIISPWFIELLFWQCKRSLIHILVTSFASAESNFVCFWGIGIEHSCVFYHRRQNYDGLALKQIHLETLTTLVRHCRRFFPPTASVEIWNEFRYWFWHPSSCYFLSFWLCISCFGWLRFHATSDFASNFPYVLHVCRRRNPSL